MQEKDVIRIIPLFVTKNGKFQLNTLILSWYPVIY